MFTFKNALRSIFRRKRKNVIVLMVCTALTVLLMIYMRNIEVINSRLDNLYEGITVKAMFTNVAGETAKLEIPDKIVEDIEATGFIKESLYSITARYSIMTDRILITNEFKDVLPYIEAPQDLNVIDKFGFKHLKTKFVEGWDISAFSKDDKVCIVNKDFLDMYELKLGDTLDMSIYFRTSNLSIRDLKDMENKDGTITLKIIGTYTDVREKPDLYAIYCPYKPLMKLLGEDKNDMFYGIARYTLKNTRNLKEFKKQCELLVNSDRDKLEFVIFDDLLISCVDPLEKALGTMKILFPYTYVVIVLMSFAVSYIMMHSRRRDMAIMMSIGEDRLHILSSIAIENLLICVIGGLIGIGGFAAYFKLAALQSLIANGAGYYIGAYIIAYMVGVIMCSFLYLRLDVIRMLSRVE